MTTDKVKNQENKKNRVGLRLFVGVTAIILWLAIYFDYNSDYLFLLIHSLLNYTGSHSGSHLVSALLVIAGLVFAVWSIYLFTRHPVITMILIGFTLASLYIIPPFLVWLVQDYYGSKIGLYEWESIGQFGDSFGVLTSIFAACAFVLLWLTYKAQKEELGATREIMDAQKSVMTEQKSVMDMQKFESAFFNILNVYSKSLVAFYTYKKKSAPPGKMLIYVNKKELYELAYGAEALEIVVKHANEALVELDMLGFLKWSQSRTFMELAHPPLFVPYHRHYLVFMRLLTFCDERCPSDSQKSFYAEIAFSTLSDGEVILLALNCLQKRNKNDMNLLAKYFFFAANPWRLNLPGYIVEKIKEPFLDAQI